MHRAQPTPAPFPIRESHFPTSSTPERARTHRLETREALAPLAERFGVPLAHVANLFFRTASGPAQLDVVGEPSAC